MRIPTRGDTRFIVGVVSGAHFLSHIYLLAYPPLFPLLRAEFGVTTTQLGLLVTAIYIPTLLFQLPLGEVVDRIGAKRVLVSGMVLTSLGITLSGLSPTYWFLLGCAFLSGIGQSVFHPANYSLLETVTEPHTEGKAFSAHTFGGFAGFAAAPVFIGTVGIMISWQFALVAAGLVGFGYAALLLITTKPVHQQTIERDAKLDARDAESSLTGSIGGLISFLRMEFVLIFCFYLISMMAIVGLQSFTTVLGVSTFGFSESTANTILTAYLIATAVGVIGGGPLADTYPVDRVIPKVFVGAGLIVTGIVLWAPAAGVVELILLFSIVGLLMGAALPSRDKLANSFADADATGKSFGFFFTGLSLGAVIAPVILGFIIDALSAPAAFGGIALFLLAAAMVVMIVRYSAD